MDRLRACGADMDGAMDRFLGDGEFYRECFQMFLRDPAFAALDGAMARKDTAAAFDAAHTLKGVSGNLGLTPFYKAVCALVELLRRGGTESPVEEYRAVLAEKSALERLNN